MKEREEMLYEGESVRGAIPPRTRETGVILRDEMLYFMEGRVALYEGLAKTGTGYMREDYLELAAAWREEIAKLGA